MTVHVGDEVKIPCYEIIAGTLSDYRWLRWKRGQRPSRRRIKEVIKKQLGYNVNKSALFEHMNPKDHDVIQKRAQNGDMVYGVGLVLKNVTEEMEGFYTCLVSNHIGSSAASMYLSVKTSLPHGKCKLCIIEQNTNFINNITKAQSQV